MIDINTCHNKWAMVSTNPMSSLEAYTAGFKLAKEHFHGWKQDCEFIYEYGIFGIYCGLDEKYLDVCEWAPNKSHRWTIASVDIKEEPTVRFCGLRPYETKGTDNDVKALLTMAYQIARDIHDKRNP